MQSLPTTPPLDEAEQSAALTTAPADEPPLAVYRLSPRETQVAILTAEGLSAEDLAASLGIRVGTLRNVRRSLRHKLDVPTDVPLNETLFRIFGTEAAAEEAGSEEVAPPSGVERRVHLSVRQAISSVGELADRLDARADAVAGAADRSRKSHERLLWESEQIRAIALELHQVEAQAIARVRAHLAILAGLAG
ncbi:MAG TPA: LuxR C-terminal-related transcriptional regulator [Acidimicrobiales bacterium]|nr:LuxR C-terminal-related transcriptional regulator [Acidimicrobiales bacterium]